MERFTPSLKKNYFKGVAFMDNNRMTYAHHIIGETHVNLLIIGSDLEALQESTLNPTLFEIVYRFHHKIKKN